MGAGFGTGAGAAALPALLGFNSATAAQALGAPAAGGAQPQGADIGNPLARMLAGLGPKYQPPDTSVHGKPAAGLGALPPMLSGETSLQYMSRIGMKSSDAQAALARSQQNPNLSFQDIISQGGYNIPGITSAGPSWGMPGDRIMRFTPESGPVGGAGFGKGGLPPPTGGGGDGTTGGGTGSTGGAGGIGGGTGGTGGGTTPTPSPGYFGPSDPNIGFQQGANTAPIVPGPVNEDWEKGRVVGDNQIVRLYHLSPKTQKDTQAKLTKYMAASGDKPSGPMLEGESAAQYALRMGVPPNMVTTFIASLMNDNPGDAALNT